MVQREFVIFDNNKLGFDALSKVLFIHHSGILGGAGISLINVVKSVARKHNVFVGVSSDPDDILTLLRQLSFENPNIKVFSYGRRIGAITYYSGGDTLFSPRLIYRYLLSFKQRKYWNRKIKEINPDVVITNSKILCWMSGLTQLKCRKSICFVRETVKGNRKSFLNNQIAKKLDKYKKVVFLSEYDRKLENLKCAETYVVHNFISSDQFDTTLSKNEAINLLSLPKDKFYVLYVGGVSEMKGFDLIVQAVLRMDDDVHLIVAGNDFKQARVTKNKSEIDYVDKWQYLIEKEDKKGRIHFLGRVKNMSSCYAACDVLVFPMRSPHQSRPAFEAGLFMKPIIISDFENISEFVRNNENGLRFPPNDVEALTNAIMSLRNDELRKRLGKNNYLNTLENHNKEKSCEKIRMLIEE